MSLQLLPPSVQSRLRAGAKINSITQAVQELVHNSLDASASTISISVDFSTFKIQVKDDGIGIQGEQLDNIGERYMTSKQSDNNSTYGYRGEALSNLRELSGMLQVVSRHDPDPTTLSVSFQQGKRGSVRPYDPIKPLTQPGTTVTAMGFMYNLPVRQKMVNATHDMDDLRHVLTGLALLYPRVGFTLRDEGREGAVVMGTRGGKQADNADSSEEEEREVFGKIYGVNWARKLKQLSYVDGSFSLSGHIASEGVTNHHKQFVYINGRCLKNSIVSKLVNATLKKSSMCRSIPTKYLLMSRGVGGTSDESPTKASAMYAVYMVRIKCPREFYDLCFEPRKTILDVSDWNYFRSFLEEGLNEFLDENDLLSFPSLVSKDKKSENLDARTAAFNMTGVTPLPPPESDHDSTNNSNEHDAASSNHDQDEAMLVEQEEPRVSPIKRRLEEAMLRTEADGARQSVPVQRKAPRLTLLLSSPKSDSSSSEEAECDDTPKIDPNAFDNIHTMSDSDNEEEEKKDPEEILPENWIRKVTGRGKEIFINVHSGNTVDDIKKTIPVHLQNRPRATRQLRPRKGKKKTQSGLMLEMLPSGKTPFLPAGGREVKPKLRKKELIPNTEQDKDRDAILREDKWADEDASLEESISSVAAILSTWQNPNFTLEPTLAPRLATTTSRASTMFAPAQRPVRFEKESLFQNVEMIGQVDKKFLATMVKLPGTEEKKEQGRKS